MRQGIELFLTNVYHRPYKWTVRLLGYFTRLFQLMKFYNIELNTEM